MGGPRKPILQQTCAVASTAAESRYRIDLNDFPARDSRVIALDSAATALVSSLAARPWEGGRFYFYAGDVSVAEGMDQAELSTLEGQTVPLREQVRGSDSVVMIGTGDASAEAAAFIGDVCADEGVMSAALVVGDHEAASAPLRALRPNAMVLVHVSDERDLADVLTALRV